MSRLPTPGGDDGIWGDILNAFLGVEHNSDGSLKKADLVTGAEQTGNKGQAGGYAPLDGSGRVPSSHLPTLSSSVPDATGSAKGAIKLTGALAGSADSPAIANGAVNDPQVGSLSQSKIANLPGDLASRAFDSSVVHNSGDEGVAGVKTFTNSPVVPASSFPETAVANLPADLAAKVSKAGDTMSGKLTTPILQLTNGASSGYVLTSDPAGNASWMALPGTTISGPGYLRGVGLSGLEFAPSTLPGTINVDFYAPAAGDYAYFKSKGLTLVRLPFLWERVQPILNGALDTAYKGYIDQAISNATTNGIKVVLDLHNFGRRYVPIAGGFTNNFTSSVGTWSGGSLSGGRYISDPNSYFSSLFGGDLRNPVSPATGYALTLDTYLTDHLIGGSNFPALHVRVYDNGNNSYYQLSINEYEQKFKWSKVIAGVATAIGEQATTISLNTLYQVVIDVNQASAGNVRITVNGSQIAQFATDPALTGGRLTLHNNFSKCAIDNVTLNVAGDTSGASASGIYRVGDAQLPAGALADVWSKLATAYVSNSTVFMYDIMNEPHDMPVPTTPSNYNTSASATLMNQAAIDAIRAVDTHTYIAVEGDQFAGMQNFTSLYGTNPSPWWNDPAGKTMASFHYYFDTDHSGFYHTPWDSSLRSRLNGEVTPALQWGQARNIPMYVGEYAVPNGTSSDAINWQQDLGTFLGLLDSYGAYASQWAGGSHYNAASTLEPFTSGSPDYTKEVEQMPIIKNHLGQQIAALPTNQGGTGLTASGTSGYVLTSDGTNWVSAPSNGALEGTTPPPATNTTGGVLGSALTAAHSDHTHALGTHDHSDTANGGNVYAPNILTYSLQGQTSATRIETLPRMFVSSTNTLTGGTVFFAYFTPDFNMTASNIVTSSGATQAAGSTLAKLGIYTVAGNGSLTCVARTASDTSTLWTTANTNYSRAIADNGAASPGAISNYALVRGTRYAIGLLFTGTTAPTLASRQLANGGIGFSLSPVLAATVAAQSDLGATYASGSLSGGSGVIFYGGLT